MAGDVLFRKGHIERDCLSRASIVEIWMYEGGVSVVAIESGIKRLMLSTWNTC